MSTASPSPKFKDGSNSKAKKPDYSKVAFDYASLNSQKKPTGSRTKNSFASSSPFKLFTSEGNVTSKVKETASSVDGRHFSENEIPERKSCGFSRSTQTDALVAVQPNYIDAATQTDPSPPTATQEKKIVEDNTLEIVEATIKNIKPPKEIKQKKKKSKGLFPKLYSESQCLKGLSAGTLFEGVLRVNPKFPSQAYVTIPGFENDVFICSRYLRNRSLNGDIVTISLLSQAEIEQITDNVPSNVLENDYKFGQIVGVQSKSSERLLVGVFAPSEKTKSYILFKPADKCMPFISVPSQQLPGHLRDHPEALASTLFLVQIDEWLPNSISPTGTIVRELGPAHNLAVANEAILAEDPSATRAFSEAALAELPQLPFSFDSVDLSQRRDLRSLSCLTIDPATARDLDDALSIRKLPDGNFRVWVHIADVSYFVPEGGALDGEAYQRGTTIYCVDRSIPMLPNVLTQDLCSLNPHVDRLALSFSWTLDAEANILASSYCRSIIHSRIRLSYADAQRVIDAEDLEDLDLTEYPLADLKADVRELFRLSKILRKRRFEQGAMSLGSKRLYFQLDDALPIEVKADVSLDSNRLVEEFMLLANRTAAEKLLQSLPNQAILRCHCPPTRDPLPELLALASRLEIALDPLPTSIQQFFRELPTTEVDELMRYHTIRSMRRACYVCAGMVDDFGHFALGLACYTHFTSPIRRYADILVHRQLMHLLSETTVVSSKEELGAVAAHCSAKKDRARLAQDSSCHLYLAHYLHARLQAHLPVSATVVALTDTWMDLSIPEFRIDRRIQFKDLPLSKVQATASSTTLFWLDVPASPKFEANTFDNELHEESPQGSTPIPTTDDVASAPQELRLLSRISVAISVDLNVFPAVIAISVVNPNTR